MSLVNLPPCGGSFHKGANKKDAEQHKTTQTAKVERFNMTKVIVQIYNIK